MKQLPVNFPNDLRVAVEKAANKEKRSLAHIVREATKEKMKEQGYLD